MTKLKREQFALGSFHYPRYSLKYFLDSAQRLGFENVEIWGVAPWAYPEDLSAADGQGDVPVGNNAAECLGNMAQFNGILHKVPFTPSK